MSNSNWHQISRQRWKVEQEQHALPASLQRSSDTDYTSGYFFVSHNVREKYPVLDAVRERFNTDSHTIENVHIDLTYVGHSVEEC